MSEHDPTEGAGVELSDIGHEWTLDEVAQVDAAIAAIESEPTALGAEAAAAPAPGAPIPVPLPIPPFPLPMRPVSGRYRSGTTPFQLELRVDVDRTRPMRRVSGDFYQISGGTKSYFGSFVVHGVALTVTPTLVTITGLGQYTWNAGAPRVRVTIPRRRILQPPAPATLQFLTLQNQPGASYVCNWESPYFRTVILETDRVVDITSPVFNTYNTGSLPSGGPARALTVPGAFAEAGIEVQVSPGANAIPADQGASWSDAELHASMVRHFSLWRDEPQFRVWELVAHLHDLGPGLLGIMFDQQGRHRQGCAVFNSGLGGTTADRLRLQLFVYVHELGHCFNMMHSWQKSLAIPPGVNRPNSMSYMNYPWAFPGGGQAAFWNLFPFQFDDGELVHLRHAYRNNIIMGGNNFRVGAGLQQLQTFDQPVEDRSGLRLEVSASDTYLLGEPLTVTLKLTAESARAADNVHPYLNPETGLVQIAIAKPGGEVVAYEPMIAHCVLAERVPVPAEGLQETVYIGYGAEGLYFKHAGLYEIRANYQALDGSQVVSNIAQLRVRNPISAEEEQLTSLLLGDEQGTLFYLRGSDSETLKSGNDALDTVLERYGDHPLAAYARLVKGVNASRDFKIVTADPTPEVKVRKADQTTSLKLLQPVVKTAPEQTRLDSQSIEYATMRLADVQRKQGDDRAAAATESSLKRRRGKTVGV